MKSRIIVTCFDGSKKAIFGIFGTENVSEIATKYFELTNSKLVESIIFLVEDNIILEPDRAVSYYCNCQKINVNIKYKDLNCFSMNNNLNEQIGESVTFRKLKNQNNLFIRLNRGEIELFLIKKTKLKKLLNK